MEEKLRIERLGGGGGIHKNFVYTYAKVLIYMLCVACKVLIQLVSGVVIDLFWANLLLLKRWSRWDGKMITMTPESPLPREPPLLSLPYDPIIIITVSKESHSPFTLWEYVCNVKRCYSWYYLLSNINSKAK